MPINNIDTVTMYSDNFRFIKPDNSKTYLPSDDFEINNWNTWMRAFIYWMRDYFGFQITAGPGTSVGIIGRYVSKKALTSSQLNFDNDWTNENFGVYPLEENLNVERVTSPFTPMEENGTVYYGIKNPDNSYTWNAKWGECNDEFGFDDRNNRFDIILTSQYYNNLGLRFKFPLTTTGIKQGSDISVVGNKYIYDLPGENLIFPYPSFLPTLNNKQIAKLIATRYNIENTYVYLSRGTKYIGFITVLTDNDKKFIVQTSTKNQDSYYCPDFTSNFNNQYYGWTPDFLNKLSSNFSFGYFRDYNKIKYIKSYDNQTLLIYITNGEKILTQFCFFKKSDHSSSLMIAEDDKKKKNLNSTWIKSNDYDFDHISINFNSLVVEEPSYGNFANIVINSNNKYHVTPLKSFKDIRGANTTINIGSISPNGKINYRVDNINENLNLVNGQGIWRLEPFNDNLSNGISSSLYLVTSAGDNELISESGKRIRTILNNKITDFIVVPFNGAMIRENDTQDNSYLIAIPIYQEA